LESNIGQDFDGIVSDNDTFENRLIGSWSSVTFYEYECTREVIPDQSVSLGFNYVAYTAHSMSKVGVLSLDGQVYDVFRLGENHNLGIIIAYRAGTDSIFSYRHPVEWTAYRADNHGERIIKTTITSATNSTPRIVSPWQFKHHLVWIGMLPFPENITSADDIFTISVNGFRNIEYIYNGYHYKDVLGSSAVYFKFSGIHSKNGT